MNDFWKKSDYLFTIGLLFLATLDPDTHCAMLAFVEAPEVFNIDAFVMNDVDPQTRCEPAKCVWTDPEESETLW